MTLTKSQKQRRRQSAANGTQLTKPKNQPGQQRRTRKRANRPRRGGNSVLPGVGRAVGGIFGMAGLGESIGSGLSRAFGSGDYRVNQNTFLTKGVPTFSTLDAPMRFRHREFLGTVQSQTGFTIGETYVLNPGLLAPILSQISRSFTMYKFHGLMFVFNSTSGASIGSTNTSLGVNGLVCHYDPDAQPFQSRQAAEEYVGCQSGVPSNNLYLPIECKPQATMLEKRFVRHGDTQKPLGECDLGQVFRFSDGSQAVSTIGEVWVTYDVEFYLPELDSQVHIGAEYFESGAHTGSQAPWTGLNQKTDNNICSIDGLGNLHIPRPGVYRLITTMAFSLAKTIAGTTGQTYTYTSNCQAYNGPGAGSYVTSTAPGTTHVVNNLAFFHDILVTGPNAVVSLNGSWDNVGLTYLSVVWMSPYDTIYSVTTPKNLYQSLADEVTALKSVLARAVEKLSLQEQTDSNALPTVVEEEMPRVNLLSAGPRDHRSYDSLE